MPRQRLLWQVYRSYLAVSLIAVLAITVFAGRAARQFYVQAATADLQARALLVSDPLVAATAGDHATLDPLTKTLGLRVQMRLTVIMPSGVVVGDTDNDPTTMDNHANRPEVGRAFDGAVGWSERYSRTDRQRMLYVAVPVGEPLTLVVRASLPTSDIDRAVARIRWRFASAALLIAALAAFATYYFSRRIAEPVAQMSQAAERYARGDFGRRVTLTEDNELAQLADALNAMAGQLDARIREIVDQRGELEAVLASMVEGILSLDRESRVMRLNPAAARLLGVQPAQVQGLPLHQAIRHSGLQQFVDRTLAATAPIEDDLILTTGGERFLQAHGTLLRNGGDQVVGALVVLNDVTRLRELENVRRDFVANVSHELMTPITSIKGFAETLLSGAKDEPGELERFLGIITRQADRLHAIADDLLSLSRLERENERQEVVIETADLRPVLAAAVQACEAKAREKSIRLVLRCEPLTAGINAPLLEQAVINLIDNAVKYSEPNHDVVVEAVPAETEVRLEVRDAGCGIPAEHLSRIFERFYRVDKARSRQLGGTGLGLAIVKHVAQAHAARVSVDSTVGQGSVFRLHLPR